MKLVMVLALVSLTISALSQDKYAPGYYVTQQNDTVHGLIRYRHNYGLGFTFREGPKMERQKLQPSNVKAFRFEGGTLYESIPISLKLRPAVPLFVNILISGEIDFYLYQRNFIIGSADKGLFKLERSRPPNLSQELASEAVMKTHQANAGAFNILFQDCQQVKEAAEKVQINDQRIRQLIRDYHECRGVDYKEYTTPKGPRIKNVGLFIGQTTSRLTFSGPDTFSSSSYLSKASFSQSRELTFGAMALISSHEPSPIVSFETGIRYSKGDFSGTFVYTNSAIGYDIRQTSETTMSYSRLDFVGGVRFTARSNRWNPYASCGIGLQHFLTVHSQVHQTTEINSSVEEEDFALDILDNSMVLWAAAGLKVKVRGKSAVFADLCYDVVLMPERGEITTLAPRVGFLF